MVPLHLDMESLEYLLKILQKDNDGDPERLILISRIKELIEYLEDKTDDRIKEMA